MNNINNNTICIGSILENVKPEELSSSNSSIVQFSHKDLELLKNTERRLQKPTKLVPNEVKSFASAFTVTGRLTEKAKEIIAITSANTTDDLNAQVNRVITRFKLQI